MKRLLFSTLVLVSLSSVAENRDYKVNAEQLRRLKALDDHLGTELLILLDDFDNSRVIPRERDRRRFVESMEKILKPLFGKEGIRAWVADLEGVTPPPPPPKKFKTRITGFFISGDNLKYQDAQALSSWQARCTDHLNKVKGWVSSEQLESYNCGQAKNISNWTSIGYYMYGSSYNLTVVTPFEPITSAGPTVSGENLKYNKNGALDTWRESCYMAVSRLKQDYGPRFVMAACSSTEGEPENISNWKNIGYFQYATQMKVWLKPLR